MPTSDHGAPWGETHVDDIVYDRRCQLLGRALRVCESHRQLVGGNDILRSYVRHGIGV